MVIVASVARTTTRTNQLVRVNSKTGRAIARVRTLDSRWARRSRHRQSPVDTRRCHRRRPGQATSDRTPPTGWGRPRGGQPGRECPSGRTGLRCRPTVGSCSSAVTRTYPRDRRRRCSRSHRQWSTSGGGGTVHWSTKQWISKLQQVTHASLFCHSVALPGHPIAAALPALRLLERIPRVLIKYGVPHLLNQSVPTGVVTAYLRVVGQVQPHAHVPQSQIMLGQ